ncbi:hypothetical protein AF335_07795 [Streptomyces eurocidicus]|uniref:DNA-binding SARP family transcriptional activator n=1 Tax=Streptomyces eurocidicus TaxID=66423 RepID=A0A2N8P0D0_STREU|nr:DNA-binding SARP family transcriptional activator [Streptomyces eurocidicus]MBF6052927.1 hypothetical protein [Streptomyces eurocidicus]PNE34476.1 hypothetical protein AF335_07795 [Streptomyces eurocidicus]
MEFRLLGTVAIGTETGDVPLGPAKRRSLLAALLLRPNYPLSVERLTAALWDHEPPLHARGVIQGHVSRLRTLLTAAGAGTHGVGLITQGAGYVLRMPETLLDAHRFEELVALAREQCAPADAVATYQEAPSDVSGTSAGRERRVSGPGKDERIAGTYREIHVSTRGAPSCARPAFPPRQRSPRSPPPHWP